MQTDPEDKDNDVGEECTKFREKAGQERIGEEKSYR